MTPGGRRSAVEPLGLLFVALAALVASAIAPYDRLTWWLEVAPVLIGIPVLAATYRQFPMTPMLYRLLLLHALILIIGGHYTYERVPAGLWMEQALGLARNPYDRVGHFVQGFVPAILAREILLRRSPLVSGKWLFFIIVCICLALSAFYELIEWWTALAVGIAADAFLGTQGDVWDTQWDMCMALVGAVISLAALSRVHDISLRRSGFV
jgi:putative membrane protein